MKMTKVGKFIYKSTYRYGWEWGGDGDMDMGMDSEWRGVD